MCALTLNSAGQSVRLGTLQGGTPLAYYDSNNPHSFLVNKEGYTNNGHVFASPIMRSSLSGAGNITPNTHVPALEIPFTDSDGYLRVGLKHIYYAYKLTSPSDTTAIISGNSMYITDSCRSYNSVGGFYFYLGELE